MDADGGCTCNYDWYYSCNYSCNYAPFFVVGNCCGVASKKKSSSKKSLVFQGTKVIIISLPLLSLCCFGLSCVRHFAMMGVQKCLLHCVHELPNILFSIFFYPSC